MAVGARITSENLSGKTATVTFIPYTGATSGTTVNLGTKTIPFNNINTHPYGVYNLYFAEYDYTYTLTIPEPYTRTQMFVRSDRMFESDNYGAATLNFNDFTAEVIDLNVDSTYWDNRDLREITEGGFMYEFRGDNNTDERLVIFTDSSNIEIARYSGVTDSFSEGSLEGKWLYAEFTDLGVLKYSNGLEVFTYDWDPLTHSIDIEWDWDAVTSDGKFVIKKYEQGQWTYDGNGQSYLVNPDNGELTSFKTWSDGTQIKHQISPSCDFIAVETRDQTNNSIYTNLQICDTSGGILESQSLTGDTYNNRYIEFHGTNKVTFVYYNDSDVDVDYKIIHYNGNTESLVQTTHVRGANYDSFNMYGRTDFWANYDNLNNGGVAIMFYNNVTSDNIGVVTTYCDIMYMFDNQTSFSTYVFADDQQKSFTQWNVQLSDMFRIACNNGDGVLSYLTIMSGSTRTESMDVFITDINSQDSRWLGNKTVVRLLTNDYSTATFKYINEFGVVIDTVSNSLFSQSNTSFDGVGEVCYLKMLTSDNITTAYYVNGNSTGFTETTYYNHVETPYSYYSEDGEVPDVMFLFAEGGYAARIISSTGATSEFNIPVSNSYSARVGKDKIMFVYQDSNDSNYIKIRLYDFSGTLLNNHTTTYTSWNSTWGAKDRFVVSFYNGDNNTNIYYLVSEDVITSVTIGSYDGEERINDYIWND
jgi:hypothetical protein